MKYIKYYNKSRFFEQGTKFVLEKEVSKNGEKISPKLDKQMWLELKTLTTKYRYPLSDIVWNPVYSRNQLIEHWTSLWVFLLNDYRSRNEDLKI